MIKMLGFRLSVQTYFIHVVVRPLNTRFSRSIFSVTGKWEKSLTKETKQEIENHWKPIIQKENLTRPDPLTQTGKDKYYVLSMFPYPSGRLHMGHVRVYTISDVMARFQRLCGKQVFHPIGWDAFGMPAENAAIERGINPDVWTKSNISSMKKQLEDLCCSFDWNTEVATCDPSYYKWTQFIFLRMMEAGLAYQKHAQVNWDPVDKTVLANEQIDENGRSWRSGAVAEKRFLKQWYIRTTAYSQALLEGLDEVDTRLWKDIVKLQKLWIGDCTGCSFQFALQNEDGALEEPLYVYTARPELVYGVTHIAVSTDHIINKQELYKNLEDRNKEEILLSVQAVHPFTGDLLPVIVSSNTEYLHKCTAHLGIPEVSETDRTVAEKFGLDIKSVLSEEESRIINSAQFSDMKRQEGVRAITSLAREKQIGGHMCSSHLDDWLISRQRYWGTPIPVIHCPKCKAVPVPDEDLPVELPQQASGTQILPLEHQADWAKTNCPKCGGPATRETDTMDTFVDSSWYFLRYLDVQNMQSPVTKERANKFMPVDLYIGGKEHALLHLFYARFFTHFLCDMGYLSNREPFINLLTQGMVRGQSYRVKGSGRYLSKDQVDFSGEKPVEKETGNSLIIQWEKMSKSKHNGVDPQEVMEEFGVDATRLCIVSNVAPKTERKWSLDVFQGVHNWQNRVWKLIGSYRENKQNQKPCDPALVREQEIVISAAKNLCILEVTREMQNLFMLNSAISRFHTFTNVLMKVPPEIFGTSHIAEEALADLTVMISPFAPSFSSELWSGLASVNPSSSKYNWKTSVLHQKWPGVDDDHMLPLKIQMNKSIVSKIMLPRKQLDCLSEDKAMDLLHDHLKVNTSINIDTEKFSHFQLTPGIEAYLFFMGNKNKTIKHDNENEE